MHTGTVWQVANWLCRFESLPDGALYRSRDVQVQGASAILAGPFQVVGGWAGALDSATGQNGMHLTGRLVSSGLLVLNHLLQWLCAARPRTEAHAPRPPLRGPWDSRTWGPSWGAALINIFLSRCPDDRPGLIRVLPSDGRPSAGSSGPSDVRHARCMP